MRHFALALRSLSKDKAFTLATFLTLAVCIGANSVLFGVVYSVLLKPLPVPRPDRLVFLVNGYPKAGMPRAGSGVPEYVDRLREARSFDALALYNVRTATAGEAGRPERVVTVGVTPSYFRVAGATPLLGRTFSEQEGEIGHNDKAVLTYAYWQGRYGGDPKVLGTEIRVDDRPYTIVGVMDRAFQLVEPAEARLWLPLAFSRAAQSDANRHNNSWNSVGRLRDGVSIAQAQADVDHVNAATRSRLPDDAANFLRTGFHTLVLPLQDDLVRTVKERLYFLWGATLLVLLIGCANVVNLALVRSYGRLRELATRLALGAGRLAIVRQVLAESLLLTVASGAAGLFLGWQGLRLLNRFDLRQIPRATGMGIEPTTIAFTFGLAILVGAVVAAFQVSVAYGANLSSVLHDAGRTGSGGRSTRRVRGALVVAQVAVAFVLLTGTALLVSSFRHVLAVDRGFDAGHLLTANFTLPSARYVRQNGQNISAVYRFADMLVARLRSTPGVVNAGLTTAIPMGGRRSGNGVRAENHVSRRGDAQITAFRVQATAGYLETLRVPLRRGRYFDARDTAEAPGVVIVDTRLAERLWPGQDPIGRRMCECEAEPIPDTPWQTVVGVVGETTQNGLVSEFSRFGVYYFPIAQYPALTMTVTVRAAGDPMALAGAVRKAIASVDPALAVFNVKTMEGVTDDSLLMRRWPMLLTTAFGVVAVLLAAIGLYGVLAYVVARRTKEIGIRMALGGTPRAIFDLVVREGLVLVGGGVAGGLAGVAALRKVLASQLYGVQAGDVRILAAVTAALVLIALVACALPARRATRVDPLCALNSE